LLIKKGADRTRQDPIGTCFSLTVRY